MVGQGRDARGLVVDRDRSDGERDREEREKRAHGRGQERDGIYMAGQLPYMDEINSFRLLFFHVARRRRLSAQLGSRTQLDRKLLKSLGRPRLHHRSSLSTADRRSAEHDTAVGDHPRIARTMVYGPFLSLFSAHYSTAVIDKPVLPPSADPHDYMSWAP